MEVYRKQQSKRKVIEVFHFISFHWRLRYFVNTLFLSFFLSFHRFGLRNAFRKFTRISSMILFYYFFCLFRSSLQPNIFNTVHIVDAFGISSSSLLFAYYAHLARCVRKFGFQFEKMPDNSLKLPNLFQFDLWVVCYEPPSRRTRHKFNPFFCNSIYFHSSFATMCWRYDACKYTIDMAIAISSSMATITAILIPTTTSTSTTTSTNRLNTFSLLTIFEFYCRHWLWVSFLIASFWSMCHEKRTTQL